MKHIFKTIAAATLLTAPAVAQADTFVLVHGAFQDAASWGAVAAELEEMGHTAIAVNLPGRDAEGDAAKAASLDSYIATVTDAVVASEDPVILVGHSFGGMTISGVAEAVPEQISRLIYVAAYIPVSGESMEKLALGDSDNQFSEETFVIAEDYSHAQILASDQVRVFAQDATPEQAAQLQTSMVREPLAPIATPVTLTDARFGTVDKAYIRTTEDRTVSTPLQTMMIERAGVTDIRDIATGHAPYLTQPEQLAALIADVAN